MKRMLFKIPLYMVLLLAGHMLVNQVITPMPVPDLARVRAVADRAPDLLFFGDSTNKWIDAADQDQRSIDQFLSEALPSVTTGVIQHEAFHLGAYADVVDYLADRKALPDVLILPINPRSFSPMWYRKPAWQFEVFSYAMAAGTERRFNLWVRPLGVFKALRLRKVSAAEFGKTPVYDGSKVIGRVSDINDYRRHIAADGTFSSKYKKQYLSYIYLYELTADHPLLKDLHRCLRRTRDAGSRVVAYLPPIDIETAVEWYGEDIRPRIRANLAVIKEIVKSYGVNVRDLTFALSSEHFTWNPVPNEHLKDVGRRYVAAQIADALRRSAR